METTEKTRDSDQTPFMLESLLVFGVMLGLILLCVFLFPEEVDAYPLQISMTPATLFALVVALIGLANLMGVSSAIVGDAAVSGAVVGDKIAKISDSFVLTTAVVGGISAAEHNHTVRRTAIPAWILSVILFIVLGFTSRGAATPVDPAGLQNTIRLVYHISLQPLLPVILIFVISALHLSGFLTLMLSAIAAVILAASSQPELIKSVAGDPSLHYVVAAIKVGIETFAIEFYLGSCIERSEQRFSVKTSTA